MRPLGIRHWEGGNCPLGTMAKGWPLVPHGLVSLKAMLEFNAPLFVQLQHALVRLERDSEEGHELVRSLSDEVQQEAPVKRNLREIRADHSKWVKATIDAI